MPKQINVYRDGNATWIQVDGWVMPADWVDSVSVDVAPGGPDMVTVTLVAEHVTLDAKDGDPADPLAAWLDEVNRRGPT